MRNKFKTKVFMGITFLLIVVIFSCAFMGIVNETSKEVIQLIEEKPELINLTEGTSTITVEKEWNVGEQAENYRTNIGLYEYLDKEEKVDKEINYIEDLVKLSKEVNSGIKHEEVIALTRTLNFEDDDSYINSKDESYGDLNGDGVVDGIKAELTSGKGFTPIGTSSYPFKGTFNGMGNEIQNIHINSSDSYVGLFGYTQEGKIKNLTVTGNIITTNSYAYTSGICGYVYKGVVIQNCHNKANIINGYYTGGIIGYYSGSSNSSIIIKDCTNSATINSGRANYMGGIIGYISYGSSSIVENCYNTGSLTNLCTSTQYIGGIVGYLYNCPAYINNCYNTGKIYSTYQYGYTGGIVGKAYGSNAIQNSYNEGIIEVANNYVGGIVGNADNNSTRILYCYNKGEIKVKSSTSSTRYIGGICGYGYNIQNCYNTGAINVSNNYSGSYCYVGGISGYINSSSNGFVVNCKNTGNITNENISTGSISNYVGGICGYSYSIVSYCNNEGEINSNSTTTGSSSSYNYAGGICGYNSRDTGYCKNIGNINNENESSSSYSYNYTAGINGSSSSSSISYCENEGVVVNNNKNESGYCQDYVGGIVGSGNNINSCNNKGDISNTSSSGSTSYNDYEYIGGIAGSGSTITGCYNLGNVSGDNKANYATYFYLGGIVGSGSNISSCYNSGTITLNKNSNQFYSYMGGVAGSLGSLNCAYNEGEINYINKGCSTETTYIGGVLGYTSGSSSMNCLYNGGTINATGSGSTINSYIGGILGCSYNSSAINNAYNTKEINATYSGDTVNSYVGGIIGEGYVITNAYNIGSIHNNVNAGTKNVYTGATYGNLKNGGTSYYLTSIEIEGENTSQNASTYCTALEKEYMKSEGFCSSLNAGSSGIWKYVENDYPIMNPVESLKESIEGYDEQIDTAIEEAMANLEIKVEIVSLSDLEWIISEGVIYRLKPITEQTIVGNGSTTFTDLKAIDGENQKTYMAVENKIERLNQSGEWTELDIKDFNIEEIEVRENILKFVNSSKVIFEKEWNVDEPNNYKVEFTLYKVTGKDEEGKNILEQVLDENGNPITEEKIGNGTVEFLGIPLYNEDEKIKYMPQETAIKRLNQSGTWEELNLDRFIKEQQEKADGTIKYINTDTTEVKVEKQWKVEAEEENYKATIALYKILKQTDILYAENIEDLVELAQNVNSGTENYTNKVVELKRTLDFNDSRSYKNPDDTSYGDLNQDGNIEGIKKELTTGKGFIPIGNSSSRYFNGIFNGCGHEILNIYIKNADTVYGGLFGESHGSINNLGITGEINYTYHISSKDNNSYIGGLVGRQVGGSINNCYSRVNIINYNTDSVNSYTGGIVGYVTSRAKVTNCYNAGEINGAYYSGGIAGKSYNSNIENCYNIGNLNSEPTNQYVYVGGIAGDTEYGSISNCHNAGNIIGKSNCVGGIIARGKGININMCYNTGRLCNDYAWRIQ